MQIGHLPAEVSIKGYVLHNVDKPSHSNRGGGSLIYVREKLQPQIKTKRATEKSEILHLNIQPHPGQTIKFVLVYRKPTCTAIEDDEFYDCLDIILSTPHETLIMGDFNLPHINWTSRQSQAPGSKLIDLMNNHSLQQHVNEPTRGNNILDLVMTTTDLSINGLEVTDKIGDHKMIDFSLEVQDPNTRTQHKQVLDYKRANFELMKEELGSYNYETACDFGIEPRMGQTARSYCLILFYSILDWTGDRSDRKSTSRYCSTLSNSVITWRSVKQSCVVLSIVEAECCSSWCNLVEATA
ncbi:Endonuclease/exonuclease/phosphatase [Trinorchestia longiramus]|nr:Endonuclease/exonuclease/phosphatase [Trinorchestia longiramus]